ncbi:hypothetical protein Hanom_Chr00s000003g01604211 [Helianthus anomalus]
MILILILIFLPLDHMLLHPSSALYKSPFCWISITSHREFKNNIIQPILLTYGIIV